MTKTPIDIYIEWFNGQGTRQQLDFATCLSRTLPHKTDVGFGVRFDAPAAFIEWLKIINANDDRSRNAGTVLSIIGITEFAYISKLSTAEHWAARQAQLETRLQSTPPNEAEVLSLHTYLQRQLATLPERAQGWIATCKSWKELRATALSNDALDDYLRKRWDL